MRTELLDPATATADQVAALHAVETAALAADRPAAPPRAVRDLDAELRVPHPDRRALHWLVTDGGTPVARAWLVLPLAENAHLGFGLSTVVPGHRRAGIGTGLLRGLVGELAAADRRTLLLEAEQGSAGAAFCSAYGMSEAQVLRVSVLHLDEVDAAGVAHRAARPEPGYRLLGWTGRCPDELAGSFATAKGAMNDAPTGSMDWEEMTYDIADVRTEEDWMRARGREWRVVAAVHEASGAIAGFTELAISAHSPLRAMTEDTGVVPAHRGHGLGLWIKSELIRQVLAQRPDVRQIVTDNAIDNDHMWRINERLGFRTEALVAERQVRVADLAARLTPAGQHV